VLNQILSGARHDQAKYSDIVEFKLFEHIAQLRCAANITRLRNKKNHAPSLGRNGF